MANDHMLSHPPTTYSSAYQQNSAADAETPMHKEKAMKAIINTLLSRFRAGKQQAQQPTTSKESHSKQPMTGEEKLTYIENDP